MCIRDSYEIVNGRMSLFGEGWRLNKNHCIEYSPVDSTFRYSQGWNVLAAAEAEGVAPNVVRFHVPEGFRPKVGNTLTIRDIIRDQVGWFIFESRDITLNRVQMHYRHGLGIVSQYTRNITMDKVCLLYTSDTAISNNNQSSTWWLRDGTFLRMKSAELGYTLPKRLTSTAKLENLRIYVSGTNLFNISKFKIWDTEMGNNGLGYPVQRVFNVGIQLSL